jgi:anti-sigma B factor antagonist
VSDLARVEVDRRGEVCVVRLHGEVDISNAQEVSEAIEAAVPRDALELAVDLTGTDYLDSAGVSLLVRLAERLQARRQRMTLVAPSGSAVRAVLEITGVPNLMPLRPHVDGPGS